MKLKNEVRYIGALLVAVSLPVALSLPCRAEGEWRQTARKANEFYQRNMWPEAATNYGEAIKLFGASGQSPILLDLKLNYASSLLFGGKIDQAKKILREVSASIEVNYSNTLLEARYLRRQRSLGSETGNLAVINTSQERLLKLICRLFGPDSPNTLEEADRLLASTETDWQKSFFAALILQEGLNQPIRQECRLKYSANLERFYRFLRANFAQWAKKEDVQIYEKFAEKIDSAPVSLSAKIAGLRGLSIFSTRACSKRFHDLVYGKIVLVLGKADLLLSKSDQLTASALLFEATFPHAHDLHPDLNVLQNLATCTRLLESALTLPERTAVTLYTQALSMYALCLVRTGHIDQAEKELSKIHVPLATVTQYDVISPVFEVRQAAAEVLHKQRKDTEAHAQFQIIQEALKEMKNLQNREVAVGEWRDTERLVFSKQ